MSKFRKVDGGSIMKKAAPWLVSIGVSVAAVAGSNYVLSKTPFANPKNNEKIESVSSEELNKNNEVPGAVIITPTTASTGITSEEEKSSTPAPENPDKESSSAKKNPSIYISRENTILQNNKVIEQTNGEQLSIKDDINKDNPSDYGIYVTDKNYIEINGKYTEEEYNRIYQAAKEVTKFDAKNLDASRTAYVNDNDTIIINGEKKSVFEKDTHVHENCDIHEDHIESNDTIVINDNSTVDEIIKHLEAIRYKPDELKEVPSTSSEQDSDLEQGQ